MPASPEGSDRAPPGGPGSRRAASVAPLRPPPGPPPAGGRRSKADEGAPAGDFVGLLRRERAALLCGSVMLVVLLPLTATTVAATVLWDAVDRGFMGRPQDGLVMALGRRLNQLCGAAVGKHLVRHEADAFLPGVTLLLGAAVPALFFLSLRRTLAHGFDPALCFAYHVFRLGPYFMNFAYCYTLCHKEGHSRVGLWKGPLAAPLSGVFNWWVGLFYGVMPSTFVYGHSINHHKYNNGPSDVISTADKPRDNFRNFVCYLPRFFLYSINVSTVWQFWTEGQYRVCFTMLLGNAYWLAAFTALWAASPQFAVWYVLLPIGENNLLLACINWTWHAFLNPEDPEDEFVGAITILDGPISVLHEDYHVVHHQYPGVHWSTHPARFDQHAALGEYRKGPATVFRGTHAFELFFLIILRQYDELAKRFVDVRGQMNHDEKIAALQRRLRACWWGPRRNLELRLDGKEVGNHELGHAIARRRMA